MKKILLLESNLTPGSPAYERSLAFKNYYSQNKIEVLIKKMPTGFKEKLNLIAYIYTNRIKNIHISMPPFRFFVIYCLPYLNIITDIRDGWSIAIKTGYGGTSQKKPLKSFIASNIEKFIFFRSSLVITCTLGLKKYFEAITGKNIVLIPNGISDDDYNLATELLLNKSIKKPLNNQLVFSCAGKFSEYGMTTAQQIIDVICERYKGQSFLFRMIGSEVTSNIWLGEYIKKASFGHGAFEILPRKNKNDLYNQLIESDYAIVSLRNPDYELGTKVYDYIALDIKVVNYFNFKNNFTETFAGCFDTDSKKKQIEVRRSKQINIDIRKYLK